MKADLKRAARIGGITALSAAAASATAFATTKFLMRTALNRDMPKVAEKAGEQIAGASVDEAFLKHIEGMAIKLENAPTEEVETVASDGTRLVGHWYNNPNAKRVILAMHGWRSSWSHDFGSVFEFWHQHDCSVLYVEQRGQNNSGGDYMGFGLTERFDCLDWANWIVEQCGDSIPVYLAGVSMGATTVLMASELPLPASVHGIFSDCGFTSPDAIWKHIANDNLHIPYGIKSVVVDNLYRRKTSFDPCYSTTDALRKSNIPVLFVHGSDDHFVPVSMTYENYKACAGSKRLIIVPGADHGMSYYVEPQRYEDAALQFWKDFDSYEEKTAHNDLTGQ